MNAALEARDTALAQVAANASSTWWQAARDAALKLAERGEFTTDDVWTELKTANVGEPHERRAVGSVLVELAREGLVRATGVWVPSTRVACKGRPIRVWVKA